ncbi:class I SAM-dependent methyltransferase [Patescibacteria group bacterium]|nr:class I SAM-dependent methyltransferase [Patescibacteria group bacterium]
MKKLGELIFNKGLAESRELCKESAKNYPSSILDLGCGDGKFTMEFAESVKAQYIYGIDILEDTHPGIYYKKYDLNDGIPFPNDCFDAILSNQNIEHIHHIRFYLEEAYRCLKPQGEIIIATENLTSWANTISLMLGWQPFSMTLIDGWTIGNPMALHDWNDPKRDSHIRVIALRALEHMMSKIGFINIQSSTSGYIPFWGRLSNWLCRLDKKRGHFMVLSAVKP